ncbi:hypothetical protein VP01_9736g1 [Puccinia sorghi]|uniref:Retrotransposon gag domain-containing protein n=1 Tax=Puccinia sorghi TaxID=27349 RepID=A0A0L6U5W6_9BASI|nr:hypothetical protein VP01_9736g1 [Puccinia sorghi]
MEIVDQQHQLSSNTSTAYQDLFLAYCSKIIFMLTKLSGEAAKWAQQLNQRVLNKSDPDVTAPTLAEFITSFNSYFLEPERKGKAQQALCTFKKSGNKEYTPQFNARFRLEQRYLGEPLPRRIEREHPTCNCFIRHETRQKLESNRSHAFKISPPTHSTTTSRRRRTLANLPYPSASLTYRC